MYAKKANLRKKRHYFSNQKSCFLSYVELNGAIFALFINYSSTMCVSATNVEKPSKIRAKCKLFESLHFARRFLLISQKSMSSIKNRVFCLCRTKQCHNCFIYKLMLYDLCVGYKCLKIIKNSREV